jgi:hypothetical protein
VPVGGHTVGSPVTTGVVFIETGGQLALLPSAALSVEGQIHAAGLVFGGNVLLQGGTIASGEIDSVICNGNVFVDAPLLTTSFNAGGAACSVDVGDRLTATSVDLGTGTALNMFAPFSVIDTGNFSLNGGFGSILDGEIRVSGDYLADFQSGGPSGTHVVRCVGSGAQTLASPDFANVILEDGGPGSSTTFALSSQISGTLTSARETNAASFINATFVVLEPGFSTSTGNICSQSCDDSALPNTCQQICG